jgi:type VI secretion system protein
VAIRGLLARLEEGRAAASRVDPVESISEHLRALLNTRKGSAPAAPHFGVPDFTELVHGFPNSALTLQQSIRATLLEYEPRLRHVQVRHISTPHELVVRFEITAQLAQGGSTLKFQTEMRPGGRTSVWSGAGRS